MIPFNSESLTVVFEILAPGLNRFQDINIHNMGLWKGGQGDGVLLKIGTIWLQLQISKSVKTVWPIFKLALTISEILAFEIFDLANVGQGHRVQLSQWCHSMANIIH